MFIHTHWNAVYGIFISVVRKVAYCCDHYSCILQVEKLRKMVEDYQADMKTLLQKYTTAIYEVRILRRNDL